MRPVDGWFHGSGDRSDRPRSWRYRRRRELRRPGWLGYGRTSQYRRRRGGHLGWRWGGWRGRRRDPQRLILGGFLRLADRLDGRPTAQQADRTVSAATLHRAAAACLREWAARPDGPAAAGHSALTLTYCAELVELLADVTTDLEAPVEAAVRAAEVPCGDDEGSPDVGLSPRRGEHAIAACPRASPEPGRQGSLGPPRSDRS